MWSFFIFELLKFKIMNKTYWEHEPIKGMKEYHDSEDWFEVAVTWFIAKVIVIAILLGIVFLLSLFV